MILLDLNWGDGKTQPANCLYLRSSILRTDNHTENLRMHKIYEYDQNQ